AGAPPDRLRDAPSRFAIDLSVERKGRGRGGGDGAAEDAHGAPGSPRGSFRGAAPVQRAGASRGSGRGGTQQVPRLDSGRDLALARIAPLAGPASRLRNPTEEPLATRCTRSSREGEPS